MLPHFTVWNKQSSHHLAKQAYCGNTWDVLRHWDKGSHVTLPNDNNRKNPTIDLCMCEYTHIYFLIDTAYEKPNNLNEFMRQWLRNSHIPDLALDWFWALFSVLLFSSGEKKDTWLHIGSSLGKFPIFIKIILVFDLASR